jgi:large repetitive protein
MSKTRQVSCRRSLPFQGLGRLSDRSRAPIVATLISALVACVVVASPVRALASAVPQPLPGTDMVNGVACPTPETCVTVDPFGTAEAFSLGSSGAVTPGPAVTATGGAHVFAVACASASLCVAVGQSNVVPAGEDYIPGFVVPLMISSSGQLTVGTAQNVPGSTQLEGIACPTSATCVAVGNVPVPSPPAPPDEGSNGVVVPIAISGSGALSLGTVATASDALGLDGIACPTPTSCVGVGTGLAPLGGEVVSIGLDSSGQVSVSQELPSPSDALLGLACPTSTECIAGAVVDVVPITVASSAGTLTVGNPQPVPPESEQVDAVDCPSATECIAAQGGALEPLSITGSGAIVPGRPAVPDEPVSLDSLACVGEGQCVAAGYFTAIPDEGAVVNLEAPTFTNAASTIFVAGETGTFSVSTSGFPAPSLSQTGALPGGLSFVDNGDGTATLTGTASAGTGGTYPLTLTATNGLLPDAVQAFSLTVDEAPAFTVDTPPLTGTAGDVYTYNFAASGTPPPVYSLSSGAPSWLRIDAATGAVSGKVPDRTTSFTFAVTATSSVGHATAGPFTVQVSPAAQTASVRYRGSLEYENSGALTSGSIRIAAATNGTVRSVTGRFTLVGVRGGSAIITVNILRIFHAYAGNISVRDPSVCFRVMTVVFTSHVRTGPVGTVSAQVSGLYRGRPYRLRFTL